MAKHEKKRIMQDENPDNPLSAALMRLGAALDKLDALSIRKAGGLSRSADLEMELDVMREDRHKLALLIDAERAGRLEMEDCLARIAPRIDHAMGIIKQSLDADEEGAAWRN